MAFVDEQRSAWQPHKIKFLCGACSEVVTVPSAVPKTAMTELPDRGDASAISLEPRARRRAVKPVSSGAPKALRTRDRGSGGSFC